MPDAINERNSCPFMSYGLLSFFFAGSKLVRFLAIINTFTGNYVLYFVLTHMGKEERSGGTPDWVSMICTLDVTYITG